MECWCSCHNRNYRTHKTICSVILDNFHNIALYIVQYYESLDLVLHSVSYRTQKGFGPLFTGYSAVALGFSSFLVCRGKSMKCKCR